MWYERLPENEERVTEESTTNDVSSQELCSLSVNESGRCVELVRTLEASAVLYICFERKTSTSFSTLATEVSVFHNGETSSSASERHVRLDIANEKISSLTRVQYGKVRTSRRIY